MAHLPPPGPPDSIQQLEHDCPKQTIVPALILGGEWWDLKVFIALAS